MVARGGSTSLETARAIASRDFNASRDSGAHLGLQVWTAPSGRGAFFHADVTGYRVTAGLPRASSLDASALHKEFGVACRRDGVRPLHFGLTSSALEFLPGCSARSCWHVGDLPVFDLARWRDDGTVPRAIRAQILRARKRPVVITHWVEPPLDQTRLNALRAACAAWVAAKPLPPLAFMTTPLLFDPWPDGGMFVAEAQGRIVGFLVASRALFGELYRIDAVARLPEAPNGTTELLVRSAFGYAAECGLAKATLGLAPLSVRGQALRNRGWGRVASGLARRFGQSLYSFAGLEAFKAKFEPEAWVPLYCVAPGRPFGLRDVLAVARVFTGGSIRRYAVRACECFGRKVFSVLT